MQVVTWTTQWCRGLDGRVDVDALCLQEIAVNHPGPAGAPGDQVAQVQATLPADWQLFFGVAVDTWDSPTPMACDFMWVSDSLPGHVCAMAVDLQTQSSTLQPLWLALG